MELIKVKEESGKRRGTTVYKNILNLDEIYTVKEKKPDFIIVRCSLYRKTSQHCPAKGRITLPFTGDLYITTPHNHNQLNKILEKKFKQTLIEYAKSENTKNRIIFDKLCNQPEFVDLQIAFKDVKRQMSRAKKLNMPREPNSMIQFKIQLEGGLYTQKSMIDDEYFYVGSAGNGNDQEGLTLVFVAPKIKKILRTGSEFLIDGTFKAAPKFGGECIQMFVIMGIVMDVGFPIIYALMSRKTKEAYSVLFKFIIDEIEINWNPQSIALDFESASIAAVQNIFPNANIVGCWFHHAQCIWRKIQNFGLTQLCLKNNLIYNLVHMFMAIPLLPSHRIREGYDTLINYCNLEIEDTLNATQNRQMDSFFHYYFTTWITGHLSSILSVSNRIRRTNNVLEGCHRNLMAHMNTPNPSPWIFLDRLIVFTKGTIHDYILTEDGNDVREDQPKKWKKQDKRIRVATEKLQQRRFSVLEFLKYAKRATPSFGVDVNVLITENMEDNTNNSNHSTPHNMSPNFSPLINSPFGTTTPENSFFYSPSLVNSPFRTPTPIDTSFDSPPLVNSPFSTQTPIYTSSDSPPLVNSPFSTQTPIYSISDSSRFIKLPSRSPTPVDISIYPLPLVDYSIQTPTPVDISLASHFLNSPSRTPMPVNISFGPSPLVNYSVSTSRSLDISSNSWHIEHLPLRASTPINSLIDYFPPDSSSDRIQTSINVSSISHPMSTNTSYLSIESLASSIIVSPFGSPPLEEFGLLLSPFNSPRSPPRSVPLPDNPSPEIVPIHQVLNITPIINETIPDLNQISPNISLVSLQPTEEIMRQSPILNCVDDEEIERQLCVCCYDDDTANVRFLPCNHVVVCGVCLQSLQTWFCPTCRSPILSCTIYQQ